MRPTPMTPQPGALSSAPTPTNRQPTSVQNAVSENPKAGAPLRDGAWPLLQLPQTRVRRRLRRLLQFQQCAR